jgi:type I restriction enzyme M protein
LSSTSCARKPGGRATIVVPDNVLFEDSTGRSLRTWMMNLCDVHTLLRLPTGIFYAHGVKTNAVFLTCGTTDQNNTASVWVYQMRANMTPSARPAP